MHLDNSSCNLASLNLLTFLGGDGQFDAARFQKCVELIITAMDISICFADFPTEPIGDTTRKFRQLGHRLRQPRRAAHGHRPRLRLRGRPLARRRHHLADDGRGLQALGRARRAWSARTRASPATPSPTSGSCASTPPPTTTCARSRPAPPIHQLATIAWQECLQVGARNGWRNAQASVLAPTGTIGLAMDCDTTGIEPDLALVKFKKLVGGGSMQIVNQTVPRALDRLGYQAEQVEAIVEFVGEHGHVVDAPGPAARALRGVRLRDGRAVDRPDGPRADDGRGAAVPVRGDLQDGEHARVGHRRGRRGDLPGGLEARPQGARDLPRQLQGRPAALGGQVGQGRTADDRPRAGRGAPGAAAAAEEAARARRSRSPSVAPRATSPRAPTPTTGSARSSSSSASRAPRCPA